MTCGRSVVFSRYSGFFNQKNWPPRYDWNIVESGVKHNNPNSNMLLPWIDYDNKPHVTLISIYLYFYLILIVGSIDHTDCDDWC
jgi:hypothetical protein